MHARQEGVIFTFEEAFTSPRESQKPRISAWSQSQEKKIIQRQGYIIDVEFLRTRVYNVE